MDTILINLVQVATWIVCIYLTWHGVKLFFARSKTQAQEEDRACVECGYDLRATPHRCPECGAIPFDRRAYLRSLREDWPLDPIEPRRPLPGEQLVVITDAADDWEGPTLAEQLRARGVACLVQQSTRREQSGYNSTRVRFCTVLVYADDAALAYEYLWRARGIPADMLEQLRTEGLDRRAADRRITI